MINTGRIPPYFDSIVTVFHRILTVFYRIILHPFISLPAGDGGLLGGRVPQTQI